MINQEIRTTDDTTTSALILFEQTTRFDDLAQTKEDYASVEENYWVVYNKLKNSCDKTNRDICTRILKRIATFLERENSTVLPSPV